MTSQIDWTNESKENHDTFSMLLDEVRVRYKRRIIELLERYRDSFLGRDMHCSAVYEYSDEEYAWHIFGGAMEEEVGISLTILESRVHDGSLEGISFMLNTMINDAFRDKLSEASFSPFNYTQELWVPLDDEGAIEARFRMVEELSADSFISSIYRGTP